MRYRNCSVPKCRNDGGHRFPKDEALRKKWIVAIRKRMYIQNWNPGENSRICRKHFKKSDFLTTAKDGTPMPNNRLKPGTVPTIFEWTQTKSKSSSASKNMTSSTKNKSKLVTSLTPKTVVLNSKSKSKTLTSTRSTSFLKCRTTNVRSKIITPMKESTFTKAKSKRNVPMTKGNSIRRDENKDISNWEYRVIRKESLHLEEILGKIEYVFSLQDLNGRELEEKELEEIISTFPPLKPPNQILPLSSPHRRSLRNIET